MPQIDIKELNSAALQSPQEMIEKAEQIYFQKIESIASHIKMNPQLRLILISGPSGSGKTTTANLLADKLRSYGNESLVISLDNFYRDQDDEPFIFGVAMQGIHIGIPCSFFTHNQGYNLCKSLSLMVSKPIFLC